MTHWLLRSRIGWSAVVVLALHAGASEVAAQTNERTYESFNFRTPTPGARAVAMGKGFVGLADDATAALSNPAGLSNLLEQEFTFEFNATRNNHERLVPSQDAQTQTFGELVASPSFASYVIPAGRFTASLFANMLQNYREEFQFDGRFIEAIHASEDGAFGTMSIHASGYGAGLSFVQSKYFSVGGTAVFNAIDMAALSRSGTPLNPRNGTDTIDSGTSWSWIAGGLIKPNPDVSIGVSYYRGATFHLDTKLFGSFRYTDPLRPPEDVILSGEPRKFDYVIPDRATAGISYRFMGRFTVLADLSRVRYHQRINDNFLIVDFLDPGKGLTKANFSVRDVTEMHAGGEYRVYRTGKTFAFRGGLFTIPDHQMRYHSTSGLPPDSVDRILDYRFNTLDYTVDVGLTAGGGVALRNGFQIDVAATHSRSANEVVGSLVVRLR